MGTPVPQDDMPSGMPTYTTGMMNVASEEQQKRDTVAAELVREEADKGNTAAAKEHNLRFGKGVVPEDDLPAMKTMAKENVPEEKTTTAGIEQAKKEVAEPFKRFGELNTETGRNLVKEMTTWDSDKGVPRNLGGKALELLGAAVSPLTNAIQAFGVEPATKTTGVGKGHEAEIANVISMATPLLGMSNTVKEGAGIVGRAILGIAEEQPITAVKATTKAAPTELTGDAKIIEQLGLNVKVTDKTAHLSQAAYAHLLQNLTGDPQTLKKVMSMAPGELTPALRESMIQDALKARGATKVDTVKPHIKIKSTPAQMSPVKEVLEQEAQESAAGLKSGLSKQQGGYMTPEMALYIAKGGAGAMAGAAVDDDPVRGALIGATLAVGGSAAWKKYKDSVKAKAIADEIPRQLSDSLYQMGKVGEANKLGMLNLLKNLPAEARKYQEEIFYAVDEGKKLSGKAAEVAQKYVMPIMAKNADMREQLRKLGVEVGEDLENYGHRVSVGKQGSIFDDIIPSNYRRGLGTFAPALEERKTFSISDPTSGRKLTALLSENGKTFKAYEDGKIVGSGKVSMKDWKEGKVKFGDATWERGQAAVKDIEAHTPIRYYHNALGAAIDSNARLQNALNHAMFIDQFKKSPAFLENAIREGEAAPRDWRAVDIPQLRGFKFEPRIADILSDYAGTANPDAWDKIGSLSRRLTGSLFWNPLPHIFNVLDHAIVQRGLVGGWLNPAKYPTLAKTSFQAWKEVSQQGPVYRKLLEEGAGMMYPSVLTKDFGAQVMKALGQEQKVEGWAKAAGYLDKANMIKHVYQFSREQLWKWNDVIMTQAYLEKQAGGLSVPQAIKEVEKHIPNYRIPDRVAFNNAFGRFISQALQTPSISAFGRYDYGRVHSYFEMTKDLIGKDKTIKDRVKAMDQIAMLGIMSFGVYPLVMDSAAKALTGNPNATWQRFGASTVPTLLYEYLKGEKDPAQVWQSALPTAPATKAAFELMSGREGFSGQKIYDTPEDIASYLAKQISPVSSAMRVQQGKVSGEQFLQSIIGLKSPSQEQVEKKAAFQEKERKRIARKRGGEDNWVDE